MFNVGFFICQLNFHLLPVAHCLSFVILATNSLCALKHNFQCFEILNTGVHL